MKSMQVSILLKVSAFQQLMFVEYVSGLMCSEQGYDEVLTFTFIIHFTGTLFSLRLILHV
jgi:hypothetical protein